MRKSITVIPEMVKLSKKLPKEIFAERHVVEPKLFPEIHRWRKEYNSAKDMIEQTAQYEVPYEPKLLWRWASKHADCVDNYLNSRFEVLSELSILGIIADAWAYHNYLRFEKKLDIIEQLIALFMLFKRHVKTLSGDQWFELKNKFILSSDEWNERDWIVFIDEDARHIWEDKK